MEEGEVALLEEEMVKLSVRSSKISPRVKPTLLCYVWSCKTYNSNSFQAQMRSIWKTSKKVDFHMAGANLFLLLFDNEEDLESILEGRPWFFCRHLVLLTRLTKLMERNQIRLVDSPFWLKVRLCPSECDKDLSGLLLVAFFERRSKENFVEYGLS